MNLGAVKSKISHQEEIKKNEPSISDKKDLKSDSFTNEDLSKAWNGFIEIRRENGSEQEVAFLKHQYVRNDNVISIQIHNSILENTFDKLKVELQAHLRKSLLNDSVRVELEKLESESKKMLYTNKEKFDHLADKHPAIKLLQEKLSLDPDY